jgi:hypothetical protein
VTTGAGSSEMPASTSISCSNQLRSTSAAMMVRGSKFKVQGSSPSVVESSHLAVDR